MKFSLPAGLLLGVVAAWPVLAAKNVAEYNARLWQSDEGLPVDAAWTVAQTSDGFLWVGTRAGLARFDGVHFDVFDETNIPGMTNPNVTGLRVTRDGSLWVATGVGGIHRLKNGQFSHYGKAEGLAGDDCVGSIFEDNDGAIWIGTLEGLSRFKDGAFRTIYDGVVRGVCQDLSGNLWFATTNGVDCWSNGAFLLHLGKTNGLNNPDVRAIYCGREGTIWLGVGAEVHRVEHGMSKAIIRRQGPNYNLVTALYEDRRGTLWAGTYNGLNRIVNGRLVPELNADGLPYGAVMDIIEDREDNIWVCAKDGLIRLKPNRILCYTQQQGLGNDNVSSVLEDQDGGICVGTWGGGLSRLVNGEVTTYTNEIPFPFLVLGMCQDRAGRFWVGTDFGNGLFELRGNHVRHFKKQDGSEIPAVRVIFQDRATNLWVGTSGGLYQMRGNKLQPYGADHGLDRDVIRAITEDAEGNLWIGTQAGLVRERGGVVTRFTTTNGLAHDYVLAVFEDKENTLWLSALEGGLIRFHDGAFIRHTTREGLFSDNISAVLEDDNGWFWMGSDRGIFRVSRKNLEDFDRGTASSLRSIAYGKTDGMMNKICNSVAKPAACKSRDGRLWFATTKGLCVINPKENILPEAPPPPVVIEELQAEQQTMTAPQEIPTPIRLGPGRGELGFRFAALGFRAPEENRYKYKLEGVDSDWIEADRRQTAHYNNIYPGHYHFRVIACNSDGVWNKAGASVAVVMLPHFWQTWWFQPGLLAVGAGSLGILCRIILLRRREIEQLRVGIAADLHDDIGSNLASIALLSQLGEKSQDKAGHSELSEIHRIALLTVHGIREIIWFINPEYDTMAQMIARMRDVAAQMLVGVAFTFDGPASSGGGKLSPEFRRNVFLIFKEILHNIVKHSQAARVEIALRETHGRLLLSVADDGRGFEPDAVSRGNGLKNIRLRAGRLGGALEIARAPAGGVAVTVSVRIT